MTVRNFNASSGGIFLYIRGIYHFSFSLQLRHQFDSECIAYISKNTRNCLSKKFFNFKEHHIH